MTWVNRYIVTKMQGDTLFWTDGTFFERHLRECTGRHMNRQTYIDTPSLRVDLIIPDISYGPVISSRIV